MKKAIALLSCLCCLWLVGCAQATATPPEEPARYLVSEIVTTYPDGTTERTEHIYDDAGIMTQLNLYSGQRLMESYTVTADEQGRTLRVESTMNASAVSMRYAYDDAGNTTKIETMLGGEVYLIQSYTYDEQGQNIVYTEDDLRLASHCRYDYRYENGLLTREQCTEDGALTYVWEYTYDEAGRRTKGVLLDQNGLLDGSRTYSYEENTTTMKSFDVQGVLEYTKLTQTDQQGNITTETLIKDDTQTVTAYSYIQVQ